VFSQFFATAIVRFSTFIPHSAGFLVGEKNQPFEKINILPENPVFSILS
jgi:hypothetical protein